MSTREGDAPLRRGLNGCLQPRKRILDRLTKLETGLFGDYKRLSGASGLLELRLNHGPGYRIYFGKRGNRVVILLCGGTKGTQKQDIHKAKAYWSNC